MMKTLNLLLRQPEAQSILTFLFSSVLFVLSYCSIIVPSSFWLFLFSNKVYTILYFTIVVILMRWLGQGGEFSAIHKLNLDGKTFLITGAAGGIGKETALELAKRGARVILFARPSNINEAVAQVQKVAQTPGHVTGYGIDLADLTSIKNCVDKFFIHEDQDMCISALINNAGVMACPFSKTKDGFEMQMGTNHFGHFYFTQLLLRRLKTARIVNVSSAAHFMWKVPCDAEHYAQMCNPNTYRPWSAYSLTKSANILFTRELQRRFSKTHGINAYSLHPGSVNTQLDRHIGIASIVRLLVKPIRYIILKSPLEGAQTNLFCALSDDAEPGQYHADCKPFPVFHQYVEDDQIANHWWTYSQQVLDKKLEELGLD